MKETSAKYARQAAYNRKTYVRFPLDLRPEVLAQFKDVCAKNSTTPTAEIKKFIARYCEAESNAEN